MRARAVGKFQAASAVFVGNYNDKSERTPEFTGARPPQPVLTWTRGEELPPFEKFNAEAVSLALDLAAGRASLPAPVPLSNGLAVQVYQLFCDKEWRAESCKNCTFQDVHRALSALHFGAPEPLLDYTALRNALLRSGQRLLGLFHKLKHDLRKRGRFKELKDMSYDEARAYLLKKWDTEPLAAAGGGGGGDPGGDAAGTASEEQPAPAPMRAGLDIRTRAFEAELSRWAVAARQLRIKYNLRRPSAWHEAGGQLPVDVLRLIDKHVRGVRLACVEREKTFELQAISLRQQLDSQRRELEEAQAEARRHEQGAIRSLRKLEAVKLQHEVELRAAADAAKEEQRLFAAQLKEQRAAAAAAKRALLAEMQAERVTADERFTSLQVEATALERQLFKAGAALRATSKEKEAELGRVEAELRKVSEGRIWSRVHEAEAKRKQAEAKVADLERQVDELLNEKRQRSQHVRAACSECALGYHESSSRLVV